MLPFEFSLPTGCNTTEWNAVGATASRDSLRRTTLVYFDAQAHPAAIRGCDERIPEHARFGPAQKVTLPPTRNWMPALGNPSASWKSSSNTLSIAANNVVCGVNECDSARSTRSYEASVC